MFLLRSFLGGSPLKRGPEPGKRLDLEKCARDPGSKKQNSKFFKFLYRTPEGPNTYLEGALGWFLRVKPLLRRYLDP